MNISEKEIDFTSLTDKDFEELCFDLVIEHGYENALWRQGSADDGRDIEASLRVVNSFTGTYNETWYFECKKYKNAVNVSDLSTKIAWADARRPDHFVLITSSYVSNQCLGWLNDIVKSKNYRIHVINGESLKRMFINNSKIYYKYFASPSERLFLEAKNNWLIHDILPSASNVLVFAEALKYQLLGISDLSHLIFYLYEASLITIDEYPNGDGINIVDVINELINKARDGNISQPVFASRREQIFSASKVGAGRISHNDEQQCISADIILSEGKLQIAAKYILIVISTHEAVELLMIKSSSFPVEISLVDCNVNKHRDDVIQLLMEKFQQNG